MGSDEIRRREDNERRAFSKVGNEGRAVVEDDANLLLPEETIERYGARLRGDAPPRTPLEQMFAFIGPSLEGKKVLEICCHTCEFGAILARLGADVTSVDIAEPLVAIAERRASVNGVTDRLKPAVMSVHEMTFPDATFDIVFGKAALHHLDLGAARREIFRVLKPGGVAVFSEPVSLSPRLSSLRERIPVTPNRESPDERPLTPDDLDTFCQPFSARQDVYYRLFSRLDRLVPSTRFGILMSQLDRALMQSMPMLRRAAGQAAFVVTR
ncbi:MAG: Methyltransferase type 11 [Deltaproteobacteria bacterium]|nr:Methyltransferase type 11 [Deltaproteobacteria bacterium]